MHRFLTSIVETGTSFDLTTVEAVNIELGITTGNTADDAITGDQITFYSKLIASLCDRVFAQETVAETFRFTEYVPVINLARFPVTEITSVTLNGTALVADTDYEFSAESGLMWRPGATWGGCPAKLVVTYTGGYILPDESPAPLARACIELIKDKRFTAGSGFSSGTQIRSVSHGDLSVSYSNSNSTSGSDTISGIPVTIAGLIAPYRRLGV